MTFTYDDKANENRVLTVLEKHNGKRKMTKLELAGYMKNLAKITAAINALAELQNMDPYKTYFGQDLGTAMSEVKHELEGFQIPRCMIEIEPEVGPIFT